MSKSKQTNPTDHRQALLLACAGLFILLYGAALSLSPAVRARTWSAGLRWQHWQGVLVWAVVFVAAHRLSQRWLPERDPYLLPLAALLSGWGLLTIWRLQPYFGQRQTVWLLISGLVLGAGLRFQPDLSYLRRYKYVWLTAGLLLTGLTLVFGTNPTGQGPRLWLGCCGVYFQPSEPLKFLLIVYLAAYLAGLPALRTQVSRPQVASRLQSAQAWLARLAPSLFMIGLALVLLLAQRDLGTATLFIFLYTTITYLATHQRAVLWVGAGSLLVAGLSGYALFDVVRVRIEAWLNPWLDPSGRSYQIIQSLLAVANGGLIGRGPGLGSPGLVPISHSDFLFTSIAEESGLAGTLILLGLYALLAQRGFQIAFRTNTLFKRLLAAGVTLWLVAQAVLIMGGNLRLLPLTGVTLPLMSYGGSSLLTSMIAWLILLLVSSEVEEQPAAPLPHPQPYAQLAAVLLLGLVGNAAAAGWWGLVRGPDLLTRTDNPRRAISDRYVQRGQLLDRNGQPLAASSGLPGDYTRQITQPALSVVIGYTHPVYGQSGLEASLDEYLRGLRGSPARTIWIDHLLYGQPPPGLDIRLALDQHLQQTADDLLSGLTGAAVLLDANTGEILVMASHPGFDANQLDDTWEILVNDPAAPLLNRATLGRYPAAELVETIFPAGLSALELDQPLELSLDTGEAFNTQPPDISPLGAALVAATLSSGGVRPVPVLVSAVETPAAGWVLFPALQSPVAAISAPQAASLVNAWQVAGSSTWQFVTSSANPEGENVTWYIGGTLPGTSGSSLSLAVAIENDDQKLAQQIGSTLLESALHP